MITIIATNEFKSPIVWTNSYTTCDWIKILVIAFRFLNQSEVRLLTLGLRSLMIQMDDLDEGIIHSYYFQNPPKIFEMATSLHSTALWLLQEKVMFMEWVAINHIFVQIMRLATCVKWNWIYYLQDFDPSSLKHFRKANDFWWLLEFEKSVLIIYSHCYDTKVWVYVHLSFDFPVTVWMQTVTFMYWVIHASW